VNEINDLKAVFKNKLNKIKNNLTAKTLERIEKLLKTYQNNSDKTNAKDNKSIRMAGTNVYENSLGGKENALQNFNLDKLLNESDRINSVQFKFLRKIIETNNIKTELLNEIIETFESVKETAKSLVQEELYYEKIEELSTILNKFTEERVLLQVSLIHLLN